ncbi:odorant receptor Or2-like [Phymastichus coffea]|uniref:odorant receptor Or2-like n=1 Tax=Phymastichus coffea TaxID=108790 RepID=UPI00273AF2E2|nr:odorant receptor Or2-like [Phymastichus coffea]
MSARESRPTWTKDSKLALRFNKFICWPLGIWPLDYDSAFSHFRLVFSFLTQLWLICVQVTPAYLNCGTASDVVDYVMMSVCAVMAISKIVTFRVHMNKLRTVFISAMNDWSSVEHDSDRTIMRSFAKTGRLVFKLQIGFSYVSNTLIIIGTLPFFLPPISTNETLVNSSITTEMAVTRELPVKSGCLFGHYRDEIYGLFYVYESIMIFITANGNVGCDIVLFSLLMHLCGQIELIKQNLRETDVAAVCSTESQEKILKFIQKHVRILDLAKSLEIATSGMLVIQLFCNAGMNLMLGLRILMALKNRLIADVIRLIFALFVLMLQLYLVSYASDYLSRQSESVVDALYESRWYELPPKLRKNLFFVAMRANKPVNLVAGQFYAINIENFKNILKASFSYFSVLRIIFDN